jgi:hypothetical protein
MAYTAQAFEAQKNPSNLRIKLRGLKSNQVDFPHQNLTAGRESGF